jgi:hypothetical protein
MCSGNYVCDFAVGSYTVGNLQLDDGTKAAINESTYVSAIDSVEKLQHDPDHFDRPTTVDRAESMISGISAAGVIDHEAQYGNFNYTYCGESRPSGPHWVGLTAGSCKLCSLTTPNPPSNWFMENASTSSQLSLAGEPWRVEILQVTYNNTNLYF